MMDNVKRIDVAARAILKIVPEGYGMNWSEAADYARAALAAADAVTAETHWLAPNEATEAMVLATFFDETSIHELDGLSDVEGQKLLFRRMRSAYLVESETPNG